MEYKGIIRKKKTLFFLLYSFVRIGDAAGSWKIFADDSVMNNFFYGLP